MNNDSGLRPRAQGVRLGVHLVVVSLSLVLSSALLAGAGASAKPSKNKKAKAELVTVTGSHIPQDCQRVGRVVVNAPSQVTVLDKEFIRRTGASTVAQVLARSPGIR